MLLAALRERRRGWTAPRPTASYPVAYPLDLLQGQRLIHDQVADEPAVVWWTPGTASAL